MIDKWKALANVIITVEFHIMLGNYQVATQLVASQVVLTSKELVA
jgi:hypothetical protein